MYVRLETAGDIRDYRSLFSYAVFYSLWKKKEGTKSWILIRIQIYLCIHPNSRYVSFPLFILMQSTQTHFAYNKSFRRKGHGELKTGNKYGTCITPEKVIQDPALLNSQDHNKHSQEF